MFAFLIFTVWQRLQTHSSRKGRACTCFISIYFYLILIYSTMYFCLFLYCIINCVLYLFFFVTCVVLFIGDVCFFDFYSLTTFADPLFKKGSCLQCGPHFLICWFVCNSIFFFFFGVCCVLVFEMGEDGIDFYFCCCVVGLLGVCACIWLGVRFVVCRPLLCVCVVDLQYVLEMVYNILNACRVYFMLVNLRVGRIAGIYVAFVFCMWGCVVVYDIYVRDLCQCCDIFACALMLRCVRYLFLGDVCCLGCAIDVCHVGER